VASGVAALLGFWQAMVLTNLFDQAGQAISTAVAIGVKHNFDTANQVVKVKPPSLLIAANTLSSCSCGKKLRPYRPQHRSLLLGFATPFGHSCFTSALNS
jgi:hypothetical protein